MAAGFTTTRINRISIFLLSYVSQLSSPGPCRGGWLEKSRSVLLLSVGSGYDAEGRPADDKAPTQLHCTSTVKVRGARVGCLAAGFFSDL